MNQLDLLLDQWEAISKKPDSIKKTEQLLKLKAWIEIVSANINKKAG